MGPNSPLVTLPRILLIKENIVCHNRSGTRCPSPHTPTALPEAKRHSTCSAAVLTKAEDSTSMVHNWFQHPQASRIALLPNYTDLL